MSPWEKMSPRQQQQAMDAIALQNIQAQQQMAGAMASAPLQTNLAPLVALTDEWTGSNLLRAYQAPESAMQRARAVSAAQQGLSRATSDYLRAKMQQQRADKPTAQQWKAATFGQRALDASNILEGLEDDPRFKVTTMGTAFEKSFLYPQVLRSEKVKSLDQAQRNFVNAVLRRESGAAISPAEFKNAEKQYFPQAGDTPEIIEQKRQNRMRTIEGMKLESGPKAWSQFQTMGKPTSANELTGQDKAAYEWAQANPQDPRAAQILQKLGM